MRSLGPTPRRPATRLSALVGAGLLTFGFALFAFYDGAGPKRGSGPVAIAMVTPLR